MPKVVINEERCKGCELCVQFCPKGSLALTADINSRGFHPACMTDPDACTGCGNCALMCPDACVHVYRDGDS
jgi:2-oxoglutarate ferredoxin oxidoreductase subunit delta